MTINELRQAPPQTKQYLDAQLLSIAPAKLVNTPRGQRYVEELQVIDRDHATEQIAYWYDIDKPDFAMPRQQINQWLQWVVKTKPNGQYLNISGYPEKAATPPQPQAAQPNAATQAIIDQHKPPQASPQQQSYTPPPQAPSPQQQQAFNREIEQPDKPDWDEIAKGKVRCNLVCAAIQGGQMKCENPTDAEAYMDYIFTGKVDAQGGGENPDWVGENPPPPADGDNVPY